MALWHDLPVVEIDDAAKRIIDAMKDGDVALAVIADDYTLRHRITAEMKRLGSNNQRVKSVVLRGQVVDSVIVHTKGGGSAIIKFVSAWKRESLCGICCKFLWAIGGSLIHDRVWETAIPHCRWKGKIGTLLLS